MIHKAGTVPQLTQLSTELRGRYEFRRAYSAWNGGSQIHMGISISQWSNGERWHKFTKRRYGTITVYDSERFCRSTIIHFLRRKLLYLAFRGVLVDGRGQTIVTAHEIRLGYTCKHSSSKFDLKSKGIIGIIIQMISCFYLLENYYLQTYMQGSRFKANLQDLEN